MSPSQYHTTNVDLLHALLQCIFLYLSWCICTCTSFECVPRMELLDCRIYVCSSWVNSARLVASVHTPIRMYQLPLLYIFPDTWTCILIFVCISLGVKEADNFSSTYWPCGFPLLCLALVFICILAGLCICLFFYYWFVEAFYIYFWIRAVCQVCV